MLLAQLYQPARSPRRAAPSPAAAAPTPALVQQHAIDARAADQQRQKHGRGPAAEARRAAAASEEPETNKKQKTEGGTGLKRADGTPWEPITGTLVPIVGGG